MHKVHHSRYQPQTDSNYANLLSLWDRLGGTYNPGPAFAELHYGLDGFDAPDRQSLTELLKMPFMTNRDQQDLQGRAIASGRAADIAAPISEASSVNTARSQAGEPGTPSAA